MYNRRKIKKNAKENIKHGYFHSVIVVFICSLLLAGGFNYTTKNILNASIKNEQSHKIVNNSKLSNSEIIDELLEKTIDDKKREERI